MKKRSIFMLASILAASFAGMATATAFIINDAASKTVQETVDGALILNWGDTGSFNNVENLRPTAPQTKNIQVKAPSRSEGVTDAAYLTLTLAAKEGNVIDGLTVKVYNVNIDLAENKDAVALSTLGGTTLTYKTAAITTDTTYYLSFALDATAYEGYVNSNNFGGTLTASYGK